MSFSLTILQQQQQQQLQQTTTKIRVYLYILRPKESNRALVGVTFWLRAAATIDNFKL